MLVLGLAMPLLASGAWLWWIYQSDRYEKEPWNLIRKTLGFGAAAGLISLALTWVLGLAMRPGAVTAALAEAVVNVLCVVTVMLAVPYRDPNWNEPFDGLVYGGAAGIGYGLVFTVPALLSNPQLGFRVAIFAIPIYVLIGIILGHYMSRVKFGGRRAAAVNWAKALGWTIALVFGIDLALREGGEVVSGSSLLAGLLAYGSNMLAWLIATRAMDLADATSPFRPQAEAAAAEAAAAAAPTGRLPIAKGGCLYCGAAYPVGSNYCTMCGNPVGRQREA